MNLLLSLKLKDNLLAFDTETTGLNPWGDKKRWGYYPTRAFAFSFCDSQGNTAYIRWKINPKSREVLVNEKQRKEIKRLLERLDLIIIGHNLSYDLRMLKMIDIFPRGTFHDTLIMSHVCTGGDFLKYGLKELGVKLLDYASEDEKDLRVSAIQGRREAKKKNWKIAEGEEFGKDPIKADYWLGSPPLVKRYAICDAERTMLLYLFWQSTLRENPDMRTIYNKEMKLFNVVRKMEDKGTRVIPSELKRLYEEYESYAKKHLDIAERNGGKDLNFRSPKQMIKKFCIDKGYKPLYWSEELKKSKPFYPELDLRRNPQVNGDFLKHLAENKNDVLAKSILEYRGAQHMITGFLVPYERFRTFENGSWVLHPNYRQAGPVTGRFSCGDPNLMQVASETTGRRRTDITLRPREAFSPRKGYLWYLPDYSQIEVWVFSFLAQEEAMMKALLQGEDFHEAVARTVWGNELDFNENKKYYRKRAKLLMFCKLYGGGVKKVAYLTDSTEQEASEFVYNFDLRLPGIQRFMERMIFQAERKGYIKNPLGRTYFLDSRFSYKAVNYLVQGTSADVLKNAMIRIDNLFERKWKGCALLLTLHDELVIEVPYKYHSKKLMREIIHEMQKDSSKIGIPVPLPVGMKIAKERWSSTTEIDSLIFEWKEKYLWKE